MYRFVYSIIVITMLYGFAGDNVQTSTQYTQATSGHSSSLVAYMTSLLQSMQEKVQKNVNLSKKYSDNNHGSWLAFFGDAFEKAVGTLVDESAKGLKDKIDETGKNLKGSTTSSSSSNTSDFSDLTGGSSDKDNTSSGSSETSDEDDTDDDGADDDDTDDDDTDDDGADDNDDDWDDWDD